MNHEQLRAAMAKAADFFEANPDKRIKLSLAETNDGLNVPVGNPHACCFCALGRIAYECGIDDEDNQVYQELREMGLIYQRVYRLNDNPHATNGEVVEALRNPPKDWFLS